MAIKLNVDQTAEVVANCKKVMNSDILDLFQSVAGKLAEAGDNEVSAQLLECCKTSRLLSTLSQNQQQLLLKSLRK